MKSIGQMIRQLEGLVGTSDLNDWENDFVENQVQRTGHGKMTEGLSEKQVEIIQKIYNKHFA